MVCVCVMFCAGTYRGAASLSWNIDLPGKVDSQPLVAAALERHPSSLLHPPRHVRAGGLPQRSGGQPGPRGVPGHGPPAPRPGSVAPLWTRAAVGSPPPCPRPLPGSPHPALCRSTQRGSLSRARLWWRRGSMRTASTTSRCLPLVPGARALPSILLVFLSSLLVWLLPNVWWAFRNIAQYPYQRSTPRSHVPFPKVSAAFQPLHPSPQASGQIGAELLRPQPMAGKDPLLG